MNIKCTLLIKFFVAIINMLTQWEFTVNDKTVNDKTKCLKRKGDAFKTQKCSWLNALSPISENWMRRYLYNDKTLKIMYMK